MDSGNAETSLLGNIRLCIIILQDMRIDEGADIALVLWHGIGDYIQVDNHQPDAVSHLRSSQANAFTPVQGVIHVLDELIQLRILSVDIFGNFAQHRLPVCIYR